MALLVGLTWLTVAGRQASRAQEKSHPGRYTFIDIAAGDCRGPGENPEVAVAQADLKAAQAGLSVRGLDCCHD